MKKIFKVIMIICIALLSIYTLIYITYSGGFGSKMQYYFWKGLHHIQNPKNEATAEIVINLKKPSQLIENSSMPDSWMHTYTWQPIEEKNEKMWHLGLQSYRPPNPFRYLRLKVILDDITFTIPNFLIMYIEFKDYRNLELRIKHPGTHGINTIKIYAIEAQPIIKHGKVLPRNLDYDFAIEQHNKLASIFNKLGFARNIQTDIIEKIDSNK